MKALIIFLALWSTPTYLQCQSESLSRGNQAKFVVETVMQRCLSRDYTTLTGGVKRISWVNPDASDYLEIAKLGSAAVEPLTLVSYSKDDFAQLLAVKFLGSLRIGSATKALEQATTPDHWVIVRLAAMDALWRNTTEGGHTWVINMQNDPDPLIAKRSLDLSLLKASGS